jgi:hypothetical protein
MVDIAMASYEAQTVTHNMPHYEGSVAAHLHGHFVFSLIASHVGVSCVYQALIHIEQLPKRL